MASTVVYATKEEFKDYTQTGSVVKYDNAIDRLLEAASRLIDAFTQAQDGFVAPAVGTVRLFIGRGNPWMRINECVAVSLVAVKDSPSDTAYIAWTAADWIPFRGTTKSPELNRTPYTGIMTTAAGDFNTILSGRLGRRHWTPTAQVTARWGRYAAIGDIPQVREATIQQAMRWFKRMQSNFADTLVGGEFGQLAFMQVLDPDIALSLVKGRLIRPGVA